MNKVEELLLEKNYIVEEELSKKTFDFSWIYIHFISSIGKSIIIFFIILAVVLFSILSGSMNLTLTLMLAGGIGAVIKYKNNFFANTFTLAIILIFFSYYTENTLLAINISYIFYLITLVYYRNHEAFSTLLPITYGYISLVYILIANWNFSYTYLLGGITFINFIILGIVLLNQDRFRKSIFGRSYKLVVIELIFTSLLLSVYYEFNYVSSFFGRGEQDWFVYLQNIIYTLSNIYLLLKLNLEKKYKITNGILLILSIKIPFIAFALFIYNLSIYYRWDELKQIAYILLLLSTFLLYHTFSMSFLQKSIIVGTIGVAMITIYIYLNKVGDKYE